MSRQATPEKSDPSNWQKADRGDAGFFMPHRRQRPRRMLAGVFSFAGQGVKAAGSPTLRIETQNYLPCLAWLAYYY
jgi:hypothetical protein